ncbi:protein of unknown function [Methylocaldum szegediense]|uniref:Uncharacterized protein n=1 Tax=Methylocaldum szegediense TaxID=73780 RepID=A0ABN8XAK4_9GAMM|nr:protein of unknown function [Methylocaldum szegediense]
MALSVGVLFAIGFVHKAIKLQPGSRDRREQSAFFLELPVILTSSLVSVVVFRRFRMSDIHVAYRGSTGLHENPRLRQCTADYLREIVMPCKDRGSVNDYWQCRAAHDP